jgi:DNA transformation protein and related proteins
VSELVDSLPDLFHGLGSIRTKRMFGGYGVYADDLFFAIVDDGVLYLKADAISAPHFTERGLRRFEFVMDGKAMTMAYFQAPEEVLEDPDEALHWGRLAIDAALRARQAKGKKKKT